MRLDRLHVLRYGCFTDRSVEFPAGAVDLQIVYGPNEAGKSTLLAAIEDLLFGIPKISRHSFIHAYKELRIGGVVQNGEDTLTFRRRKGVKDTILDEDEQPLAATALNGFLDGADQAFYKRMFSLDHIRLRRGGKEILAAKDEIGQMLFAAGAGVSGLKDELDRLENEAERIWAPRKAGNRIYYQAADALEQADKELKQATVLARAWKNAKSELDRIVAEHKAENERFRSVSAEREKLERIRRVMTHVARMGQLLEEIKELGRVPELPDDAASILATAQSDRAAAESRIESLSAQIKRARKDLDEISVDHVLLAREADISSLEKDRVVVEKDQRDIPNRLAEIKNSQDRVAELMQEVGWSGKAVDEADGLIQPRTKLAEVRNRLEQKGAIDERDSSAEEKSIEQRGALEVLQTELQELGEPPDASELGSTIQFARQGGDVRTALVDAEHEQKRLAEQITAGLEALVGWSGDEAALRSTPVPSRGRVEEPRGRFDDVENRLTQLRQQKDAAGEKLEDQRLRREQLLRDERAVPLNAVEEARQHRDLGWEIVRDRYISQRAVEADKLERFGGGEDIAAGFEQAVRDADEVADRRFDSAEAAARLVTIDWEIERLTRQIAKISSDEQACLGEREALLGEWNILWEASGLTPLAPAEMLDWLAQRDEVIDIADRRRENEDRIERLMGQETEAKKLLLEAMVKLGAERDALAGKPLAVLVEEAAALDKKLTERTTKRQALVQRIEDARRAAEKSERDATLARQAVEAWREQWTSAVRDIGLAPEAPVDVVRVSLDIIEEIGSLTRKIREIQTERVDTMQRDIDMFCARTDAVIAAVSPEMSGEDPAKAVLELKSRLDVAREARTKKDTLAAELARRNEELSTTTEERDAAVARAKPLLEVAAVADWTALKEVIARVEHLRKLEEELGETTSTLGRGGDGKSPDELREECEGADPDRLKGELDALSRQISEVNERLQDISARKQQAEGELDTISGSADAATAAADRQQALAQMREATERYLRVRTAAKLLRWAIERYRKEKQAPLLKRAGGLFRTLTLDEFEGLSVDYDENDQAQLAGIRSNGVHVPVDGLSDGTIDQLYFALRVAAVEEYLENRAPLPFIADDLFINYDDARAAAGFRVLAEFARHTQVLFFTHHKHLLSVAESALQGPSPAAVYL